MTSIPDSSFTNPSVLNQSPIVASFRYARLQEGSVAISQLCQDSNNPSLAVIDFTVAGHFYFNPYVNILQVDGDTSYQINNIVAPISIYDVRTSTIPINTNGRAVPARIVADFGSVIPNFLQAQNIVFELKMVGITPVDPTASTSTQTFSTVYTWSKGVLPTPISLDYSAGSLTVYFQYAGKQDCSCNIQCISPSGVSAIVKFCPNDVQSYTINQTLNGEPFTFSLALRDNIGNVSEVDITALTNVIPSPPVLNVIKNSSSSFTRIEIAVNGLTQSATVIPEAEYQIIKFTNTPNNYSVWKDWSEDTWGSFIDYDVRKGNRYGYCVRYKGKLNDVSSFSNWTTITI